MNAIRNFVIIAHVDHGKSTLADRLLEITGAVPAHRMKEQYLDQLDLERERGITIKMAPVRMNYTLGAIPYTLNLIDTPGHSDFSYEVSRALRGVEGAILLVDVTKGIQAQTLSNYRNAKKAGLTVVGAVNKIDLPSARTEAVAAELAALIGKDPGDIFRISGRTGKGVPELLAAVVRDIPPPKPDAVLRQGGARALVFDSLYDDHKGILAFVRVVEGLFRSGDEMEFLATGAKCKIKEVGMFMPQPTPSPALEEGEIGYIATGFKEPAQVAIGDTAAKIPLGMKSEVKKIAALSGYKKPSPVVFISFYPDGTTEFDGLKRGLERLRLTDAALDFEPDSNEALGRGLKVGFLGQLHFEITASRLEREFNCAFITSFPSIAYRVIERGAERVVKDPHDFPADPDKVLQPMISIEILVPASYLHHVLAFQESYELEVHNIENIGEHAVVHGTMPLAELIRDFDDQLKSATAGYASFSYEQSHEAPAKVERLEILVAGEVVPALTRIVFTRDVEREGRVTVERLKKLLPAQQFSQAIQARAQGRIIARETIAAQRKDVTGYLYGGDRSRKMKLWKKQKKGKEKLQDLGRVHVPVDVFREILKK